MLVILVLPLLLVNIIFPELLNPYNPPLPLIKLIAPIPPPDNNLIPPAGSVAVKEIALSPFKPASIIVSCVVDDNVNEPPVLVNLELLPTCI